MPFLVVFVGFWLFFHGFFAVFRQNIRRSKNHRSLARIGLKFGTPLTLDTKSKRCEFQLKRLRITDFRQLQRFRQIGLTLRVHHRNLVILFTLLYLADYRPQENISVPYISFLLSFNITYLSDRLISLSSFLVACPNLTFQLFTFKKSRKFIVLNLLFLLVF